MFQVATATMDVAVGVAERTVADMIVDGIADVTGDVVANII